MNVFRTLLLSLLLAPAALAQTWAVQASGTASDLNAVYARTTTEAYVAGDDGTLLRTTDAGQTWTPLPVGGFDFEGVGFSPNDAVGLVATDNGPVLRSTDGVTWTLISTGSGDNLRDVSWASNTVVWSVGREGDGLRSLDAGQTWSVSSIPNTDRLRAIAGVSATNAFAVGEVGQIFATTNGGASWTAVASGTGADLHDIHMVTATTGYIAGSNNTVLKTTDGGATWANVSSGGAGGDGVFFVDVNRGWVVGNGGQIWFTADGGATWALQPGGTAASLSGVHFADPSRGWAVGDGGAITRFTGPGGGGLTVTVTPLNPPIVIPAGGGTFRYTATLANTGTQPQTFQAWAAVTGPANREPISAAVTLTLPAGGSITRTLTVRVPGIAPAGTYTFFLKVGTLPSPVLASDSFTFTKSAAPLAGGPPAGASGAIEAGLDAFAAEAAVAGAVAVAPNPFARETAIRYAVAEASDVRLAVYDVLGREVAVLVDGRMEAGTYAATFDARGLAAGTYVYRLAVGNDVRTGRMTLAR